MIAQENFQTTTLKTIRILVNETTLTIDHKTIQTTDRLKIIIIVDPVIILELEKTNYQTYLRIFFQLTYRKITSKEIKKIKGT